MNKLLAVLAAILFAASTSFAQWGTTGTTTLSVTVAAEAELEINTATTTFSTSANTFADYTGTTNLGFRVRTGAAGGSSGTITLQITSDFAPTGGPTFGGTQLTAGDNPTYICGASSMTAATPCSGTITPSLTASQPVYSFGANAHSQKAGDTGAVTWTVPNDPLYPVNTYHATATFTISAT